MKLVRLRGEFPFPQNLRLGDIYTDDIAVGGRKIAAKQKSFRSPNYGRTVPAGRESDPPQDLLRLPWNCDLTIFPQAAAVGAAKTCPVLAGILSRGPPPAEGKQEETDPLRSDERAKGSAVMHGS